VSEAGTIIGSQKPKCQCTAKSLAWVGPIRACHCPSLSAAYSTRRAGRLELLDKLAASPCVHMLWHISIYGWVFQQYPCHFSSGSVANHCCVLSTFASANHVAIASQPSIVDGQRHLMRGSLRCGTYCKPKVSVREKLARSREPHTTTNRATHMQYWMATRSFELGDEPDENVGGGGGHGSRRGKFASVTHSQPYRAGEERP
jgi:hypothetical protein